MIGLFVLLVFAVATLGAGVWLKFNTRRQFSDAQVDATIAEVRARAARIIAGGSPGSQAPQPPSVPIVLDEDEVNELAVSLVAAASRECRRAAEVEANTALMDEYATKYPMKQRPRLVERSADTETNPLETSHDR